MTSCVTPAASSACTTTTRPNRIEATQITARPKALRPGGIGSVITSKGCSVATGTAESFMVEERSFPYASRTKAAAPVRAPPDKGQALHAERGLVELDLVVAADLVGDLLPGGCDGVGALLRIRLAGEDLGQLVLGDGVVLEDAGDARLDRGIFMVIRVAVGEQ